MTRVLFDSSILVAGALDSHVDFDVADAALLPARKKKVEAFASQHAFAEVFGKLTGLPLHPRISPQQALLVIEHYRSFVRVIELSDQDYQSAFIEATSLNVTGASIYDLLHIKAARRVSVDRIETLKVRDFVRLSKGSGIEISRA